MRAMRATVGAWTIVMLRAWLADLPATAAIAMRAVTLTLPFPCLSLRLRSCPCQRKRPSVSAGYRKRSHLEARRGEEVEVAR
jgi:hypothetical protein